MLPIREIKESVLAAINSLGPGLEEEEALPGDKDFRNNVAKTAADQDIPGASAALV